MVRNCLKCRQLFSPPIRVRFMCDSCNRSNEETNRGLDLRGKAAMPVGSGRPDFYSSFGASEKARYG